RGFLSCRNIQKNGVKYGIMFNFKSMDKAYSVMNEISQIRNPVAFDTFKTADPVMRSLLDAAKKLAVTDETVLVTGAPGSGKSMLVRAIHDFSDRAAKPFLVVNCRGFSPEYLEAELFGRDTEAEGELAPGSKLRIAQGGTVFFRHVEELPLFLQKRLTQIIKAKKLEEENAVAARLLFSSDDSISSLAERRLFDEELAVRISQYSLSIPPLLARPADVRLLVDLNIEKYSRLYDRRRKKDSALPEILYRQTWFGNVRQIEKTIEYLLSDPSVETLSPALLEERVSGFVGGDRHSIQSLEEMEKEIIQKAMTMYRNKDDVARALQIGRATLYRKLKQYDIA
ncbi:MAG: sigma 54-interacting transcriptional regulator, partial [Treponemataceae bacterium]